MTYERFEDTIREQRTDKLRSSQTSPYSDFIYYESTRTPGVMLAALIIKPAKPSYILAGTHGWHMSAPKFKPLNEPNPNTEYLEIHVDMRGRAFSDGAADCNGWELYDVIDAINYVRTHYSEYIVDPDTVYFESGSGGGGNAMAIVGKFPDFFAAATALCGISDYGLWYANDDIGEFRDEMDVWIGTSPSADAMAYRSRSGLELAGNLITPIYLAHGSTDIRVPVDHSRLFVGKAAGLGKSSLVRYTELTGVGTRNHWGNATEEMMSRIREESEENRIRNRKPIQLPEAGRLTIGGYLFTKPFSVVLDSSDKAAYVDYDLNSGKFDIYCERECGYTLTVGGQAISGQATILTP